MTSDRFNSHKDTFEVLDLKAKFCFKSSSSVCFNLGSQLYSTIFGDIQVHHPCTGHIKAFVYIHLPDRYRDSALLTEIRKAAFRELAIPEDETYELFFFYDADCVSIVQPVNREGFTDRV